MLIKFWHYTQFLYLKINWHRFKHNKLKPSIESLNQVLKFFPLYLEYKITLRDCTCVSVITHSNDLTTFVEHLKEITIRLLEGATLLEKQRLILHANRRLDWWLITGPKFRSLQPIADLHMLIDLLNKIYQHTTTDKETYIKRVTAKEMEVVYNLTLILGQILYER